MIRGGRSSSPAVSKRDTRPAEEIKGAVDFFDKIEDEYGDIIVEEYAKREKRLAYEKEHPAGGLVAGVKRTAKKIANKL